MQEYTMEEVRQHTTAETGIWLVMDGKVYDVTKFERHPGQFDILLLNAGRDASKQFNDTHSEKAHRMREQYLIGTLKKPDTKDASFEVKNVVPESDVPRFYYLLPASIFAVLVVVTLKNNHII